MLSPAHTSPKGTMWALIGTASGLTRKLLAAPPVSVYIRYADAPVKRRSPRPKRNPRREEVAMEPAQFSVGNRVHELAAIVAMIRAKHRPVPVDQLATLIDHAGSAVELVQLKLEDVLFTTPEADYGIAGTITTEELRSALGDVEGWIKRGLDMRTVLDAHFPQNLHSVFDRPPLLFFQGTWREVRDRRSIAIVGTREASDQGLARAGRLARELVSHGFTIISGLAAGIDSAAHNAALDANGRTVAVMGTGLDHVYPASNRSLAERILSSGGALISQFFPHQTPRSWMFPLRNVVMSGLALATVVVEASEASGAKMQSRVALQHGRAVFLLRSLVESHDWARRYVEEGAYGTRAIEISTVEDITQRLDAPEPEELRIPA